MLTDFQRRVVEAMGRELERHGFALGGGQALHAHNIVDRPSQDLDNYSDSMDPKVYEDAERAVVIGKVRALVDRRAERDYIDIDSILSSGAGWSIRVLLEILREIRPELTESEFLTILTTAHQGDREEYAALGLSRQDMLEMFRRLRVAAETHAARSSPAAPTPAPTSPRSDQPEVPRCVACGRPLRSPASIRRRYGPSCSKKTS